MALTTIHCEDCGKPRLTGRRNTKYCRVCRLLKNINFIGDRTSECPRCKKRYAPVTRNDLMCGKCNPRIAQGKPTGICGFCKEEKDLIDSDIKVCHGCATEPDNRLAFTIALLDKVETQRTTEYPQ